MGDYTGGFTSALNDISSRDYQQVAMQRALQQMTITADQQAQQKQDREDAMRAAAGGVTSLLSMVPPPNPQDNAPRPDVSPPPGQASQPMMMPHPSPMPGMGAPMPPPGGMAAGMMAPPGAPPQPNQMAAPQPPAGWQPSPGASPALGGPPPGSGRPAVPGAPPAGGLPPSPMAAGGGMPPPQSPMPQPQQPPAPPGMPPMGGAAPGGIQPGASITPQQFLAAAIKSGASPLQAAHQLDAMLPAINAQNADTARQFKQQAEIAQKVIDYQNHLLSEARMQKAAEETARHHGVMEDQGQERADKMRNRGAGAGAPAAGGPAAPAKPLSDDAQAALDTDSWNFINKGILPNRKGKGGAGDYNQQVRENAAKLSRGLGMTPEEVSGQTADWKSGAMALQQSTKDLAAIQPFKSMLDTNADKAIELGKKVTMTDSALANKTLNWVKQNAGNNPDTAEYLAQIRIVQTEAARVLNNPRLVGQLTDSARHEMDEIINGDMPIGSTERVIRRIQQDGNNRVNAMESTQEQLRNKLTGKARGGGTPGEGPAPLKPAAKPLAPTNAKGWKLMKDAKGNTAYVSPDGKQFEEAAGGV